jgi:SAM-dependent methyltransferase
VAVEGCNKMAEWWQEMFGDRYFTLLGIDPVRTTAEVDGLERVMGLQPGAAVLDVACGRGRHSLELARRGYRVTGLDYTQDYVEDARRQAREEGLDVEFILGDMREMSFEAQFDAAINMFTAFGFFESDEDDLRTLEGVTRALKPGGKFLIDYIHRDGIMRRYKPRDWDGDPQGDLILMERRFDVKSGRNMDTWTFFRGEERRSFDVSVRFYAYTELAALIGRAGMDPIGAWGGLGDEELTMDSTRMVVLAEKRLLGQDVGQGV